MRWLARHRLGADAAAAGDHAEGGYEAEACGMGGEIEHLSHKPIMPGNRSKTDHA
jgi:hypothetical protein